MAELSTM